MTTKKQPYTNTISDWLIIAAIIGFLVSCASCATTNYKKDCRGVRHEKQKGGFYLYNKPACPDCRETNCIYEDINNAVEGDGTDSEIEQAIQDVCKSRNITNPDTIDLLRANYYL